jgi:hypothetical protein
MIQRPAGVFPAGRAAPVAAALYLCIVDSFRDLYHDSAEAGRFFLPRVIFPENRLGGTHEIRRFALT